MKESLQRYYDKFSRVPQYASNVLQLMFDDSKIIVHDFYNEVQKLEAENKRLRDWLRYIKESDSSVVPGGFHETMAMRALRGDSTTAFIESMPPAHVLSFFERLLKKIDCLGVQLDTFTNPTEGKTNDEK